MLAEFAVQRDAVPAERAADYADYNVAPTKRIYAVMDHKEERELRLLRWGLVPFWAKDVKGGARLINARSETVAVKPAFRAAFAKRRCLIPADGYYEWQTEPDSKAKQPFYIYRTDGGILAFAGLYELWRNQEVPDDHEDAWYWSGTIITTDATDEIGKIHDRTPMVIAPGRLGGLARPRQQREGPPAHDHAPGRLVRIGRPGRPPRLDRGQLRPQQRSRP